MPNRIIKESICDSERIASLTDFEFRLWVGLITQADDAGRGDARPAYIKGHVFPFRDRVTAKDIDASLHALAAKGCVTLYTVGGRPYFWFPSWAEHQRIRDCRPKYPGPEENDNSLQPAATCGNSPQLAATCGLNPIRIQSESISESESESDAGARVKHKHGQYSNVLLTDEDLDKLKTEFPGDWSDRIERLSEYMASTGKSYKNHLATVRNWARKDAQKPKQDNGFKTGNPFLEMLEEERRR